MNNHKALHDLHAQLEPVFAASRQGMYLYLDDVHKVCNKRFASMLEYDSPSEWAGVTESFPVAFVDDNSQQDLVGAFQEAMHNKVGSALPIAWKTKTGRCVSTQVLLVPISFQGVLFALHFVTSE